MLIIREVVVIRGVLVIRELHLFIGLYLCQVIEVIKKDILSASARAPKAFLEKLTSILNQGSIHSAADQFNGVCGEGRGEVR